MYGSIGGFMRRRRVLAESPGAPPRARVRIAGTWLSGRLQARAQASPTLLTDADFAVVPLSAGWRAVRRNCHTPGGT